jgi:alkylhydroperoxidase family enzyme
VLQARGQDSKRTQHLQLRMVTLLQQLGKDEPLDPEGEEYRTGLAALRDQQLQGLQTQVEREVAALAVMQQRGAVSTQSHKRRAQSRRKKVRQLIAAMQTWQQTDLASSEAVEQLPATWGDDELAGLFAGKFPWRRTGGANEAGVSLLLAEQFRDACAEVGAQPEPVWLTRHISA